MKTFEKLANLLISTWGCEAAKRAKYMSGHNRLGPTLMTVMAKRMKHAHC